MQEVQLLYLPECELLTGEAKNARVTNETVPSVTAGAEAGGSGAARRWYSRGRNDGAYRRA